ncbi:MAG: methyltransferase domain-containing protein [Candidatus Moranbacteria bacterium]|nr:methyltransferase domain-containing protein [Candidatus Moranbacteria bacterium]
MKSTRQNVPEDQKFVEDALKNDNLRDFVYKNFQKSLSKLGCEQELIDDFLKNLPELDLFTFWERYQKQLQTVFNIQYRDDVETKYFKEHVVSVVQPCTKVADIGCGTGVLAKLLLETDNFEEVVGIEIDAYPEWDTFSDQRIRFEVVKEENFDDFLLREFPDSAVLAWVLHHMDYDQQMRYMQRLYAILKPGAQVVVLEDGYSTMLVPQYGKDLHDAFMRFSLEERHAITGVNDWCANRVLRLREKVPCPFGYRTVEDWKKMFGEIGYKNVYEKYIGFPDRDVLNPQCVMVFEK